MKILVVAFILVFSLCGCDLLKPPLFYHWPKEGKGKRPVYAEDIFSTRKGDKLAKAIVEKDYLKIEKLLYNESLVNESGIYGVTPLWIAVKTKDAKAVKIFLKKGSDPNPAVSWVEPPLIKAARYDSPILALLLEFGADPHATYRSIPCVFFASYWKPNVDLLLEAGADLDQITDEKQTTIMLIADRTHRIEMILYLLEKGADPALQDINGRGLVDIMDYLSERSENFKKRFAPVYQWLEENGYDLDELRNPEWEAEWRRREKEKR